MEIHNVDTFYLATVNESKKVAEEMIKEKYNLKNDLVMIGQAVRINSIINQIQDEKLKEKAENDCEKIWNKWYEKVQKEQLINKNLGILDLVLEKLKKGNSKESGVNQETKNIVKGLSNEKTNTKKN